MQSYKDYTNELIINDLYRNLTNESIETSQFYEMVRNNEHNVLLNTLEHGYITEEILSNYTRTCFGFGEFKTIYDLFKYGLAIYGSKLNNQKDIDDVNISDNLIMHNPVDQWIPENESLEKYIKITFEHFHLNTDECFVVLSQRIITTYELFNIAYKSIHKESFIDKLIVKNDDETKECMLKNEEQINELNEIVDIQNTELTVLENENKKYKSELTTLRHENKKYKSESSTLNKKLKTLENTVNDQRGRYGSEYSSLECRYRRLTTFLLNHGWNSSTIIEIESDP